MRLGTYYRRLVLQHLGVSFPPGLVLDVGAHDGAVLAGMPGVRPVGLDPAPAPPAQCRVPMVRGDGRFPPFRPGTFAAVLALDVLEHEADDGRLAAALMDLLAPGGTLWVSVPHREYRAVPGLLTHWLHRRWGHVRPGYSAEGLAALFGPEASVAVLEWHEPVFRLVYFPVRLLWGTVPPLARLVLWVAALVDARLRRGRHGHVFARVRKQGVPVAAAAGGESEMGSSPDIGAVSPPVRVGKDCGA